MARLAPIKTAQQAAAAYGANGSSAAAQNLWATNFSADIPGILAAAAAAGQFWQTQVQSPTALTNYQRGLQRAANNVQAITTKVNGVGKASFAAGVKAASTGDYLTFAQAWQTAVGNEVSQLDRTNPRGDRAANRARQAAYDAWVDSQAGNFRVK
jgi:hypothetical protein